ncbi:uncharacterized protein LOC122859536 isoform X2 [Aphidius gifuensis]|uniref:uncharacterized protein LOC122859536 isoform X2 n=1 Tax=Aphidius gifuensis TaxID=684658 RepID=UPI001CDC2AB6|nr:uncharacterized protein LOC122859536 isoform X2 [Aphidius gifuensis]
MDVHPSSLVVAKLVRAVEENTKLLNSFMSCQDEKKKSTMTKEKLSEKYHLHFPISNLVNFKEMNDLITKNDSFKKDMCQVLLQYTEKKNYIISLSLVTMLKAFLTRELTMNYVAQRESNGKFAMNHTPFYICLKEVIIDERSSVQMTTSENEILCALGSVLTNAINWPSLIGKKISKSKSATIYKWFFF